jgi:membrane fusion protein (multidrug efflux system)
MARFFTRKPESGMKKVLLLVLALGAAALVWWWQARSGPGEEARPRPPIPVTAVTVEERPFSDRVSALGTLLAWESVDITASVSQIITDIRFEDGQRVAAGDVLALLKQDEEQAILRELQESLKDAAREVRRLENLARQNQVAQTELDRARTQAEITRHRIEQVRARIEDRTIVAPFAGVLGLREVSEGALVTPGQRLTTLDDISRMRLEFSLPATRLGFLAVGREVTGRTPAFDRVFEGVVSAIDSRIDPVARAVIARAVLENPDNLLRPGLLMEVELRGDARRALLVPEESLLSRASEHYVWRLQGEAAQRVPVTIGSRIPGWVEVTGGLEPGDRVVQDGVGRLSGEIAAVSVVEG